MTRLICSAAVRQYLLDRPSAKARGFTRVSEDMLNRIDARLREICDNEVATHPSKGKTLK